MGELAIPQSRYSLDTEIQISTGAENVAITPRDVLQWLQPAAPPHECLKFLMISRAMGLNPFTKEIYLADFGGQWITMVDKSGWIKKAEQHPQYDGFEAGILYREVITPGAAGRPPVLGPVQEIEGSFLPGGHIVVGGWAKVYRKDRSRPTAERVSLLEYSKPGNRNWDKLTCTMIRKVALVHALRESGVVNYVAYEEDEFPKAIENGNSVDFYGVPASGPIVTAQVAAQAAAQVTSGVIDAESIPARPAPPVLTPDHEAIVELVAKLKIDDESLAFILGKRGVSRVAELTPQQAMDLAMKLQAKCDQDTLGDQLAAMVSAAPAPAERLPDEPAASGLPSEAAPVAEVVESSESSAVSSRQGDGEVVQSSSQDVDVTETSGDSDVADTAQPPAGQPEAPFDATPDSPKGRRGRRAAMATA